MDARHAADLRLRADPASLDGMMDELVRSAPEEPDTQLFEDSIRWHHEMFAYEALFRTLTP